MGEDEEHGWVIPDWYVLFEAAQTCNCPPWELLSRPDSWIDMALNYERAKAKARLLRQGSGLE